LAPKPFTGTQAATAAATIRALAMPTPAAGAPIFGRPKTPLISRKQMTPLAMLA